MKTVGTSFGLLLALSALSLYAQTAQNPAPSPPASITPTILDTQNQNPQLTPEQRKAKREAELRAQKRQRVLGIMPEFNTSNVSNAEPLTPAQKFELAAKTVFDPFTFAVAGIDATLNQLQDDFPEYGQGVVGFAKRFGASYADSFDGTMIGNALFPVILKQDPRYFRKGTGTFAGRFFYAITSTFRCKNDNGHWAPNYSNVLGNIAAGTIANLYYPPSDRGIGLTAERAGTVTAEGAIGAVFIEFWPDISRKLFAKKHGAPAHAP